MSEADEVVRTINIILIDETLDQAKKMERIEIFIDVYIQNNTQSMSDMI